MKELNIFISYSRSDSAFVIKLEEDLARKGVFIWLDQKKISAGKLWDRAVEEALESSGILIVVVSQKSALSENVANEVQYARDEGKLIVPILIEQTKIPLTWRRYQRIDFIENYEAGLNNLAQTLKYELLLMFNSETDKDVQRIKEEAEAKANAAEVQRLKAEAEAKQKAEEESKIKVEAEAKQKTGEERRKKEEAETRRIEKEKAKAKEEEEKRVKAEAKRIEEEKAKNEEDKRLKAEAEAKQKAEGRGKV